MTTPFFSPILPQTPPIPIYSPIIADSTSPILNTNGNPNLIIRSISPPTPAPSPRPEFDLNAVRGRFSGSGPSGGGGMEEIEGRNRTNWSPTTARDHWGDESFQLDRIRREFSSMSLVNRQKLLEFLIFDSSPASLSPLLPLIIPRLKRDFLKTLPIELAFHVLCFVDNVKTLARASGVSRFWRGLLEDDSTWKRMCWKSGFGDIDGIESGEKTAGERLRSLEFGEREEEIGTPAGRERRGTLDRNSLTEFAARAELFGLRPVEEESSRASWFQAMQEEPRVTENGDWGPWGAAGLGFAGGIDSLTQDSDSVEESTARLHAARDARRLNDLPLPSTPQQPVPFNNVHSIEELQRSEMLDSNHSATRNRQRSMPGMETLSPTTVAAPLLPAYRSPLSFSVPPSATASASAPISRAISPGRLTIDTTKKPFSYKTHFKRAYLTESNWLRGPGRLLSAQISHDDGVVTSLGFDSEWIVVGMATSKVHIFKASNGDFYKTLEGHELGVWCLILVSTGGGVREERKGGKGKGREEELEKDLGGFKDINVNYSLNSSSRRGATNGGNSRLFTNDSPTSRSPFFRHPRPTEEEASAPPLRRRRSFQSFDENVSAEREEEGARTGGMGLGAGGETGDSSQQAGVCGTARGYGRDGALVVSGGCDRDVRVWDVKTG